jgi:hypothetical protein
MANLVGNVQRVVALKKLGFEMENLQEANV